MKEEDFKKRTKSFALRIIRLVDSLPTGRSTGVLAKQLLRSGTSVGANYRAACRAKSRPDFISKMGTVEEECDESIYWMELLIDSGKVKAALVADLMNEANEILSMVVASITTARTKNLQTASRMRIASIRNPQSAIQNP